MNINNNTFFDSDLIKEKYSFENFLKANPIQITIPIADWNPIKEARKYSTSELKAVSLKNEDIIPVDSELKKILSLLKEELYEDLRFLQDKEKNEFFQKIKFRLKTLKADLKDSGFIFQQLYFANNELSANKNINKYLNYSMPDRAILGYLEEILRYKHSQPLNSQHKTKIDQCILQLKNSLKISLMNSVCIYNKNKKSKRIQQNYISNYLKEQAKRLEIGESMGIPCGYFKGSPYSFILRGNGHAVMCDIKRISEDQYELCIINTGEGNNKLNLFKAKKEVLFLENGFFKKLTNCLNLSTFSRTMGIDYFYDLFMVFIPEGKKSFESQNIENCTQYSIKAYIDSLLNEDLSLATNFEGYFFKSVQQKCENFLHSLKDEKLNKKIIYKHPFIKPKNMLQFVCVWLLCLLMLKLIVYKNKQYGFKLTKKDYTHLLLDSKANF